MNFIFNFEKHLHSNNILLYLHKEVRSIFSSGLERRKYATDLKTHEQAEWMLNIDSSMYGAHAEVASKQMSWYLKWLFSDRKNGVFSLEWRDAHRDPLSVDWHTSWWYRKNQICVTVQTKPTVV